MQSVFLIDKINYTVEKQNFDKSELPHKVLEHLFEFLGVSESSVSLLT